MSDMANGMLVQHPSLGLGKVIAVEATAVHVFFPEGEKRYAVKLRWPFAKPLLKTDGVERNAWLEGLSSFTLDPETGRYALGENWLTQDQAIAEFVARYPQGFADPEHAETGNGKDKRASRWRAANAGWVEAFGDGQGERLLAEGDVRELVRRALRVERHLTPLSGALEEGALKGALEQADAARLFFDALFGLLAAPVPGRARFEKLFAAVVGLGGAATSSWPIATVFPFVAQPERHVVLWPKSTRSAAERLGCDLRYEPMPNWATYSTLRAFSAQLLDRLKAIGARDFIDVEAFLHVTATKRSQPANDEEASDGRARTAGSRVVRRAQRERRVRSSARSRRSE